MTGRESQLHLYIWHDRFLYVGPSKATSLHRNHAAVWLNASAGQMHVTLGDGTVLADNIIYIPSGTEYSTEEAQAAIAALFWEPESASFLRVADHFSSLPRALGCPHSDASAWATLADPATSLADAEQIMSRIFGFDFGASEFPAPVDSRISVALSFLRESPEQYGSLALLADKVHLSPSRLAHLFKHEVGVPVRRYVLWMKMRRALDLAIGGNSLTTAALSAGFADSAHLSRTVRAMMGIAPEFLFRHRERLVVHH